MIRVLAMIAVAGFLVSAVTLSVAVAITGPEAIIHGAWSWGPHGWGWRGRDHDRHESREEGEQNTRELTWTGGDRVIVSVPADVTYTQADGPAKVTVSGPSDAVAAVHLEAGQIRYDEDRDFDDERLKITITAPSVSDFALEGDETLAVVDYKQSKLSLSLSGRADVKAAGETRDAEVNISGSGRADLAALKITSAKVEISGSGKASLAPSVAAEVDISGDGDVTLLSNPPQLRTSITGAGEIHRPGV